MTKSHSSSYLKASALVASMIVVAACNPIKPMVTKRGYVPDEERLASIEVGVDNKDSVYSRLGSPSTDASFDRDVWYYISSRHERTAFMPAVVADREVVSISFDETDMVSDIGHYGLEDGKVVAYVERKTPTRGKELGFLEQMFGNLGRLPAPSSGPQ
jgi:outer membrane protein assembly factor BamE (lipoprotein component of BamABCDE complex)